MEIKRNSFLKDAPGEQVPNVLIKQEVEWLAEDSHTPGLANQEITVKMESLRSIKTEEDPVPADAEAHGFQEFTPVSPTDEYIKAELILDEDKINETKGNCKQNVLAPADVLDPNSGCSTQISNQQILAPLHGQRVRPSISYKESEPSKFSSQSGSRKQLRLAPSHKCEFCPRTFKKKYLLRNHLSTHADEFPCDLCDRTFSSKFSLRNHKRAHTKKGRTESEKQTFICEVCQSSFTQKENLKVHMLRKHSDKVQLNTTGPQSSDDDSVNTQTEEFLDNEAACYSQTSQESTRRGSESNSDIKSDACDVCHCIYPTEYIRTHMRLAHSKHKCEFCSHVFKTKCTLKRHLRAHGEHAKHEFPCDSCERTFSSMVSLRNHKRAHTKMGRTEFETQTVMKSERSGFSSQSDSRKRDSLKCEFCPRIFKKKYLLRNHLSTHAKKFPCVLCERSFPSKLSLRNHKRVHTKKDRTDFEKQTFLCEVCGCSLARRTNLKIHMFRKHLDKAQPKTLGP